MNEPSEEHATRGEAREEVDGIGRWRWPSCRYGFKGVKEEWRSAILYLPGDSPRAPRQKWLIFRYRLMHNQYPKGHCAKCATAEYVTQCF